MGVDDPKPFENVEFYAPQQKGLAITGHNRAHEHRREAV